MTTTTWFVAGGGLLVAAAAVVVVLSRLSGRLVLTESQTKVAIGVIAFGVGVAVFTVGVEQFDENIVLRGIGQGLCIGSAVLLLNELAQWIRKRRQRDRSG